MARLTSRPAPPARGPQLGDPGLVELVAGLLPSAGWTLTSGDVWCTALPAGRPARPAGWKLHLSATPASVREVLRRAVPLLAAQAAGFKFAVDVATVRAIVSREWERAQAGKVVTVYPGDDEQFVALAAALDAATRGLAGPRILSDRPYRPGGIVHYRYGAIDQPAELGLDGAYRNVLAGPGGATVTDRREPRYTPPDWAPCPLPTAAEPPLQATAAEPPLQVTAAEPPLQVTAAEPPPQVTAAEPLRQGAAAEPQDRSPAMVLLAGRFTVRAALRHSVKGGIYLAEDTAATQGEPGREQHGRTVVVKQGRAYAEADESGRDARDSVRHEAAMLRRLAPTGLVPALVGTFTQGGDAFLVEEYLDLPSVAAWLTHRQGALDGAEAVALARRLVAMLARVHDQGVVVRDLSPANVLVDIRDAGLPRLVDLELAAPAGTPSRPGGTAGYRAPERIGTAAGRAPVATFAEDRYALGCLLLLLATGADPVVPADDPPGAVSVSGRLRAWLDAATGDRPAARALRPAITALLRDDPAERASLAEVDRLLARAGEPARLRRVPADIGDAPAAGVVADPARLIGDGLEHLVATMQPQRADRLWATNRAGSAFDPAAVQHGAAGVLDTLTAALATPRTGVEPDRLRTAIRTTAEWLLRRVAAEPRQLPGLYFGRSGTAWALYEAGRVLRDDTLTAAAVRMLARIPLPQPANPDVAHGLAGAGLAALHLWTATGQDAFLARATRCAEALRCGVRHEDGQLLWPIPAELDSVLAGTRHYGFAHGSAGVGYFLLAVGAATGDERCTELALAAADALCDAAVLDDGAAWWPGGPQGDGLWPHWCNGSSGIGTFLLRAWRRCGRDRYAETARAAAEAVHRARFGSSPAACHGLAGNGEFLLDAAELLGEPALRERATDLARLIGTRYCSRGGRLLVADETGRGVVADAGVGLAGTLRFLMRLEHGGARPWMVDDLLAAPQTPDRSALGPTVLVSTGSTPHERPPQRVGFRFSPSGRHAVCLAGTGGRYRIEAWSCGPEPRARWWPGGRIETGWTQPIPLDDGRLLVTRPIEGCHHVTLAAPDGEDRPLGVVDAMGLRLVPGPGGGSDGGTALGWALSTHRDGTSRLWRVDGHGLTVLGRLPGVVPSTAWLDDDARMLAVGCLHEGRMKTYVVELADPGADPVIRPLAELTDAQARPLLCAPEAGLLVVGRGRAGIGLAADRGRGPLTFPEPLRATDERGVWPLAVDPAGRELLVQLDEPLRSHLAVYRPGTGTLEQLPVPDGVLGGVAHRSGDVVRFPFSGPGTPHALAELDLGTGRFVVHGAERPPIPSARVRRETFDGPAGPVEALVYGERAGARDVLVALHGGPLGAWRLGYDPLLHELAAAGLVVVAPNLRGGVGAGPRDPRTGRGAWGGPDLADLRALARQLRATTGGPLRLLGASYGAFLALLAAGTDPDFWSHVVAVAPFVSARGLHAVAGSKVRALIDRLDGTTPVQDELGERDVTRFAPAVTARVLVAHGTADDVIPVGQGRTVRDALRAVGASPEYREYPGAGHHLLDDAVSADLPAAVVAFLATAAPPELAVTTA